MITQILKNDYTDVFDDVFNLCNLNFNLCNQGRHFCDAIKESVAQKYLFAQMGTDEKIQISRAEQIL